MSAYYGMQDEIASKNKYDKLPSYNLAKKIRTKNA